MAINTVYQLEKAVNNYMEKHGYKLKKSFRNLDYNYYNVLTEDFTLLEGRIIKLGNERTRVLFKVDGKITSLYK